MTFDELNDLVLSTAERMAQVTGRELTSEELHVLNDKLTEFLQDIDVDVSE